MYSKKNWSRVKCVYAEVYLDRGGAGGPEPPRNLVDQLTLFEPGWAEFAPQILPAPPDSKSYLHLLFLSIREGRGGVKIG